MTNQEGLSYLLANLRKLDDERIQAERILEDDPANIMGCVIQLFAQLYPFLPTIQHQFHELRNNMNSALVAKEGD